MINNLFYMSGYGIFVWSSFFITFFVCGIFYYKTRKTLKKYEKEFAKELEELSAEKRKLVQVLDNNVANNPAFVTPDWEQRIDAYETYYDEIQQKEGPANIDAIIQSKYPTWEYEALEKARKLREAEKELGYTEDEINMIKQSFSPQTSSVTLTSAFSSLYGPSLFGDLEEEDDDDGTESEDD